VWDQYGIDCEEELPEPEPGIEVVVPDIAFALADDKYDELKQHIDPLQEDDGFGIDIYIQTCLFVADRLN
jgi:hypothetical protein